MHILVTGGTGFIGQHLVEALLAQQHKVFIWCRNLNKARQLYGSSVELFTSLDDIDSHISAVINLAGEPIIGKSWSPKRKQQLMASRIHTTRAVVQWLKARKDKPHTLISGSAIGYYGNYPEATDLDESAAARDCFPSQLCRLWEAEAQAAAAEGVRVCTVRTGVVLNKDQGALKKMWLPFSMGFGGDVGTGDQWLSWIHYEDMMYLLLFLLHHDELSGPINATAPQPVRYKEFTRTLARALKRPHLLPMPAWLLNNIFGEAAQLLLEGQKVVPKKLLDAGFRFTFCDINSALNFEAGRV